MASTYSDLKIELIGTGEQSGTWGVTNNVNLGTAIEEAIVGRANANFTSDANLTITLTNTNTTQVARHYILNVTSAVSLSTTRNLIVPTIDKPYIIENNTTGSQSIIVKTALGTGVTVPNGKRMMVYANSTNVVDAFNNLPAGITIGNVAAVTTSSTDTLTNKTISVDNNTVSGIAASSFVLSNSSGNIDGSAAQKAIPTGNVVGTTDTQTLTNKSLTSPTLTGTPTAPTAAPGTNTNQIATTAFVTGSLGTMSTQNANNVAITGGSITGITDLAVADGGTGVSSLTANAVLLGNGTSAVQTVAPGTSGNVLTSNGTTWQSIALSNFFTGANQNLGASGYQILPGGLIIQWFKTSENSTQGSFTVNYPIAFPNAFLAASCSTTNTSASSNADLYIQFVSSTTTAITLYRQAVNNFAAIGAMVIAIGY